ncbi:hypothetical protein EKO04_001197 [Ascochyta lentis]|uniref:Autophagy-related protein 13 n=1 Tax=Ascochyta lentis TaxID=205686 RepID=A0A8H7J9R5_9PLEO|nr:hypothetical protein EKO04_001197 [Ascochyta lentis]
MQPSYQRPSPRTASAANSLQTNPTRTNNQRYGSPYSDTDPYSDRGPDDDDAGDMASTDQRNSQKVNQVIQNFFTKAALTIVSSRVILPQAFNNSGGIRQNKWFNVVLDDTDVLQQDLTDWKGMDAMAGQHPPLCIEIYLDMKGLGHKQSLVIHDENGKRWDVSRALDNASSGRSGKATQVLLERWTINVGDKSAVHPTELSDPLPNVYKKAVVLFRSLYTYIRFIPAFKYYKSIAKQPANHPALKLAYRITNGDFKSPHVDTLEMPLYQSDEPITDRQDFGPSHSPVGPLGISVQYRTNCEFSVEDSESLLSSEFMGLDNTYFEQSQRGAVPGSLPVDKLNAQETPDVGQAYGSLSTFHQVGPPTGTSPISALRAVRDMPSSSPTESPPQKMPPKHRVAQGPKSSLRSGDVPPYQRRTSVSFQPFKAGSLSSSPALGPAALPSPSSSLGRPSSSFGRTNTPNPLLQPRNRTSLTTLPQQALRTPSLPNETAIVSSASSSPRPAPIKYSSSFGHRRNRFSTSGGSKTEDDNLSSGKGSVASSLQRGSDVLNEGEGGSSGEVKSDDDNISDFLKLLEAKKELKSFNCNDNASKESAMRRTTAQLSKYQRLKDSHAALSDSVSSSTMLHRSSSSSSRHLSSVPAMIAGTSVSTASSPGKPISPHTPHTPAIPSRLSANSIIEYEPRPRRSRSTRPNRHHDTNDAQESTEGGDPSTNAIDIPTSPRHWNYARRSSSVAQQERNLPDDDPDIYGRAASVPLTEAGRAKDLTPSGLFAQGETGNSATQDDQGSEEIDPLDQDQGANRPSSSSNMPAKRGAYSGSSRGRTSFFSHGSSSGATSSTERPNRYSFSSRGLAGQEDDEPLLFQMSEIGAGGSRRSLEEAPGGSGSATAGKRMSPWGR